MASFSTPVAVASLALASIAAAQGVQGYYRQPAIHGDTIVFVAEGDLWRVGVAGGRATRLTSHPGEEGSPAISPDGKTLAFTAQYEGPTEVYTMPMDGGLPTRRTFDAGRAAVQGWTSDGRVIVSTDRFSTLPSQQLFTMDLKTGDRELIPLAQAAEGCFEGSAKSPLYFTRLQFQGSNTKRYKGGTAQNLWKFVPGAKEAVPLTADYEGTSKRPMWWPGKDGPRAYFLTDRDGAMNIWSMSPDGKDLRQHTRNKGFDAAGASLDSGKIAYQLGADLRLYDIAADKDAPVPVTLDSDFDQERERWAAKPMDYVTAAHLSADGDRVALTARGQVFVAPARQGRLAAATHDRGVRYRAARFLGEGQSLVTLSDKSGEVELWETPANGLGAPTQLTSDAQVLRWDVMPSPDGKLIASHDKNLRLWIYDAAKKAATKIDESQIDDFADFAWSGDSRFLAYVTYADNSFRIIKVWSAETGKATPVTTDRFDSFSPEFSPDGKWLYFLSDRNLKTFVESPWGSNQPDPFLDKTTKIYQLALKPGQRSPFQATDEVFAAKQKAEKAKKPTEPGDKDKPAEKTGDTYKPSADSAKKPGEPDAKKDAAKEESKSPAKVEIEFDGLVARLYDVPIPAGNYSGLMVNDKALFYSSHDRGEPDKSALMALAIQNDPIETKQIVGDVKSAEMSADGKKLLLRKADTLYILDADPAPAGDLDKKAVDLSGWMLSITPRDEWRQMYTEAWRLERDYFWDTGMHAVNWNAMREKYRPLVDRVASRAELADILAQMIGELSALHMFVRGGDLRTGADQVQVASLGAVLTRDAIGWKVERIYQADPDDPQLTAPLARPGVDVKAGDVITAIDGVGASAATPGELLRNRVGKQVLIHVKPGAPAPAAGDVERDAVVVPMSAAAESDLRYHDWEYSRRRMVEEWSHGQIGYLHLRAMGGDNFTEFARGFYPVFTRQGLIVDVRHNRGGNIDSWILGKLMRKAWFYWSQRVGNPPSWNMQYAFRGHMAALCDEFTASDGEAFSEGFKRLGLGKVIGTRTWGGEIWLSSSNILVDKGIATAAENGVYGPEGQWLIEGRGVEPDMVVDNPPHATFAGEDAQLKAAVDHLMQLIKEKPVPPMAPPKRPDKSFDNK